MLSLVKAKNKTPEHGTSIKYKHSIYVMYPLRTHQKHIHWHCSGVFIVNFEQNLHNMHHNNLMFLLTTLNMYFDGNLSVARPP